MSFSPDQSAEILHLAERKQPHNLEVEEAVLGGCLVDPHAIDRIANQLTAEAFYLSMHRVIFQAMLALHADGKPTDVMSVLSRLTDAETLKQAGGQSKLSSLWQGCVGAVNIDHYAALLNEKWLRRRAIATCRELAVMGSDTTIDNDQLLEAMEQKIFALTQQQTPVSVAPLNGVLTDIFAEIQERSATGKPVGIPCGFYDLDAMTQGLQRSDLIIGAGRPSMGKTSFLLNVIRNVAAQHLPVLLFSLEMSKEQLAYRLVSSESHLESGQLKAGRIRPGEWELLSDSISKLSSLPIWVDDRVTPTLAQMRSTARRVHAESGQFGLIAIDYLQMMELGDDPVHNLGRITKGLKAMAREMHCPVIALSQLSRAVENRTNKRPIMSDLRESGAIEQDADLILMLYRDEYYNPDTVDRGIAEVIISKHRNGPTGMVKLLFESQFTQFRNLAKRLNG